MPWADTVTDTQILKRCVRDLVALSTLPAIWRSYDPMKVGESVTAALASMLDSDLVMLSLPSMSGEPGIEVITNSPNIARASAEIIGRIVIESRPNWSFNGTSVANPLGDGMLHIASAPLGFDGHATLTACSRQQDFPTPVQRLLLGIAANEATVALERWRAESAERRSAALLESSADFVGVASLDGLPQYINPAGLKLVGLSGRDQLRQLSVLDFLVADERSRARDEIWSDVMRKGRWVGELNFRHFGTGAAIPFLVDWFRIDDPRTGEPMNMATVSRDLTAQKRQERELRLLNESLEGRVRERTSELAEAHDKLVTEIAERKRTDIRLRELQSELLHSTRLSTAGQMAAALTHELNQPLTATGSLIGAAKRLLASGLVDTAQQVLGETAEQVFRAGEIIRRLRDFVSRRDVDKREESVAQMIEDAGTLALAASQARGANVRFLINPNATFVFADRIQIQQVLINLMRNAMEAIAESDRRELTVSADRNSLGMVEIAVADSGPGLPPEVLEHLFEPFVSTKRHGMGLGLVICRDIVAAHGGTLRHEANPEGGTIFRFTLDGMPTDGEYTA